MSRVSPSYLIMMFRLVVHYWARCLFSRVEFLLGFKLAFELRVLDRALRGVATVTVFGNFSVIRLGSRESERYESLALLGLVES